MFYNRTLNNYCFLMMRFKTIFLCADKVDWFRRVVSIGERVFQEVFSKRDSSLKVLKIFNVKKASQKL